MPDIFFSPRPARRRSVLRGPTIVFFLSFLKPWQSVLFHIKIEILYILFLDAILNSPNHDLRGSRMYVTLFPCNECAKAIIQSGIKELIYLSDKYHDTHASIASRRMFNMTGVKYRAYQPTGREIKLDV